jgi:hypothetical protein
MVNKIRKTRKMVAGCHYGRKRTKASVNRTKRYLHPRAQRRKVAKKIQRRKHFKTTKTPGLRNTGLSLGLGSKKGMRVV